MGEAGVVSAARALAVIAAAFALAACPAKSDDAKKNEAPPSKCARFGQTCEFAPGKLGTCVEKESCDADCFVCQSQH